MELGAFGAAVLLALVGYLATYFNNVRIASRADQVERVNRQLRELYGPLLSIAESSTEAKIAFHQRYGRGRQSFWGEEDQPTEEEAEAWRSWIILVFQPMNEELARLVTSHADLLEGEEMPRPLLSLYAHVASYRPVIDAWQRRDFTENAGLTLYPDDLLPYARMAYRLLKERQGALLQTGGLWLRAPWRGR